MEHQTARKLGRAAGLATRQVEEQKPKSSEEHEPSAGRQHVERLTAERDEEYQSGS